MDKTSWTTAHFFLSYYMHNFYRHEDKSTPKSIKYIEKKPNSSFNKENVPTLPYNKNDDETYDNDGDDYDENDNDESNHDLKQALNKVNELHRQTRNPPKSSRETARNHEDNKPTDQETNVHSEDLNQLNNLVTGMNKIFADMFQCISVNQV